jgi:hypothetical protein
MLAIRGAGLSEVGASGNYVKTITAPSVLGGFRLSEFTNGKYSGWMYTINGRHPGYGLKEQALRNGDAGSVSSWAEDAMAWAVESGLITGRTETTLAPAGTATRAEAATLLQRYLERAV